MKKVLTKITWKMRKHHIRINLFDLYVNDTWDGWGLDVLRIQYGLESYSLLQLLFLLPNGAERRVVVFSGDFLFLRTYLLKLHENLLDNQLWGSNSLSNLDNIKLKVLNFIFK
jgi:hypothetical protein